MDLNFDPQTLLSQADLQRLERETNQTRSADPTEFISFFDNTETALATNKQQPIDPDTHDDSLLVPPPFGQPEKEDLFEQKSSTLTEIGMELTNELVNKMINNFFSFDTVCNRGSVFLDLTSDSEEQCLSKLLGAFSHVSVKLCRFVPPSVFVAIEKMHGCIENLCIVHSETTQTQSLSLWDIQRSVAFRLFSNNLTLDGPCFSPTNAQKLTIASPILDLPRTLDYDIGHFAKINMLCLSNLELDANSVSLLLQITNNNSHVEFYGCKFQHQGHNQSIFARSLSSLTFDTIIGDLDSDFLTLIAKKTPCINIHRCKLSRTLELPAHVAHLTMTNVDLSDATKENVLLSVSQESCIECLNLSFFFNKTKVEINGPLSRLIHLNANGVRGLRQIQSHGMLRVMCLTNTDLEAANELKSLILAEVSSSIPEHKLSIQNCPLLYHLSLSGVNLTGAREIPNLRHVQLLNGSLFPQKDKRANIEIREFQFP